jgi:hypothetical protein
MVNFSSAIQQRQTPQTRPARPLPRPNQQQQQRPSSRARQPIAQPIEERRPEPAIRQPAPQPERQQPRRPEPVIRQPARQPQPKRQQQPRRLDPEIRGQPSQGRRQQQNEQEESFNPFRTKFSDFDASFAHKSLSEPVLSPQEVAPRPRTQEAPRPAPPAPRRQPSRPRPRQDADEPFDPFRTKFSDFDASLAHGAPRRNPDLARQSVDEPVPLSEARFVVGDDGRISGSFGGSGDFFGPYESVNLGQGIT